MNLITLDTINSTNIYAKNNIDLFEDKTVIHALNQTAGRGRLSRKWVDLGSGNLFVSFVLKPFKNFNPVYSNLTQYTSVVLAKMFENYGLNAQIKWPNDVLIDGKKIAGILSETVMQGSNFKGLVLGVGINLNCNVEDLANITDKVTTSLNIEINKSVDMNLFLKDLTDNFFAGYDEFLQQGFKFIKSDYISRTNFLDTEICVQILNDKKCGLAKDINDFGELLLEDNGKEFILNMGDIL